MRGRSVKQEIKKGEEFERKDSITTNQEPHLSGAYIRSLVKQLTSSNTMNPHLKYSESVHGEDSKQSSSTGTSGKNPKTTYQQPQHKKQVRRRLHTSRPYQERLLNMAEARREIVTALKFHRASMKQANEQRQQLQQQQQQSESMQIQQPPYVEQEAKINKSRRNPRIYPANSGRFSNYMDNFSYTCFSTPHPQIPPDQYSWPPPQFPPPSVIPEPINFALPNQPLGLNLNLHDFNNTETSLYNYPSVYSSSSTPSSSSSISMEIPVGPNPVSEVGESCGGSLHPAIDVEEMAAMRSIGEQHQVEWNDTMNLMTSAWWCKFLKNMELKPEAKTGDDELESHPFDEVMELSSWLKANESCCLQPCSSDYYCSDQDPTLPCMDIGEIENMDEDWLA